MTGKDVACLSHYYGLDVVDNGTHGKGDAFKSCDVVILASKPAEHPYQRRTENKRDEVNHTDISPLQWCNGRRCAQNKEDVEDIAPDDIA